MSHGDKMLGVKLGVANIDISSKDLRLFNKMDKDFEEMLWGNNFTGNN